MTGTLTMVGRSVRLSRRNVDTLLMSILLPVMMMALFVYVFGGAIATGTSYVNYVVPGMIVLCTGYGASSTAMSVTDDMQKGAVDRFRSMPISSFAVLTGHVTASVARNALATAVVVLAAVGMGFRPSATVLGWVLGSRRGQRMLWLAGAVLMGVVLAKLVLVDRQHLGNLLGIGSFIAYGLLCTVVGYFAPAPPRAAANAEATNGEPA